jgi:hypothetical protein
MEEKDKILLFICRLLYVVFAFSLIYLIYGFVVNGVFSLSLLIYILFAIAATKIIEIVGV